MITTDVAAKIVELREQRWSHKRIARELGLNEKTVAKYLATPMAPTPDSRQVACGTERPIAAAENGGAVAASVFEHFEAGSSPCQVVVDLKLDPDRVRCLHEQWTALHDLHPPPDARARVTDLEGKVADLTARLKLMEEGGQASPVVNLSAESECAACHTRSRLEVLVKCSECGDEWFLGWEPEEDTADDRSQRQEPSSPAAERGETGRHGLAAGHSGCNTQRPVNPATSQRRRT